MCACVRVRVGAVGNVQWEQSVVVVAKGVSISHGTKKSQATVRG